MYGKELEGVLKKEGISVGYSVTISNADGTFEGVLMPRSSAGDSNIMVLKRTDGYNIGIKYSSGTKIKKTHSPSEKFSFPKGSVNQSKSLPKIGLIYTGGTIGSKVDYTTGGVYMLTKPEELLGEVPELTDIANIDVSNPMSIASEDMNYLGWQKIAEEVVKAFDKGARGIVVTLGTDTMHYTSAALSFMLQNLHGPVILTGAQRSSDRGSSDAFLNLICAAHLAANSDIAEVGICMHASSSDKECNFIRGVKVRKMHTSRRDAFKAINTNPIASVDAKGKIEYRSEYRKMGNGKSKTSAMTGFEDKTALLKFYPSSNPEIIEYYVDKRYKGIIIEGTGMGHVATPAASKKYSWIDHIKYATDKGVVVGITSQCIYGRVNPTVYRNLRLAASAGAIHCDDMLSEVAYVKLGFLLGNYKADKVREMLSVDIAGEITKRTEYKEDFIE